MSLLYSWETPKYSQVGNTPDPCTQKVILKKIQVCPDKPISLGGDPKAITLNMIDTPGLNEENVDNDVKHMSELLQESEGERNFHRIYICFIGGARFKIHLLCGDLH
jgi:hypothetical protein